MCSYADIVLIFRHTTRLWWLGIPTTSVTQEKCAVVATVVSPQSSHSVFPTNAFTQSWVRCSSSSLRRWSWSSPLSDLHTMISISAPLLRSLHPACPLPDVQSHLPPVFYPCELDVIYTCALSSAIQGDIKSLILTLWVQCSITLCYFSF